MGYNNDVLPPLFFLLACDGEEHEPCCFQRNGSVLAVPSVPSLTSSSVCSRVLSCTVMCPGTWQWFPETVSTATPGRPHARPARDAAVFNLWKHLGVRPARTAHLVAGVLLSTGPVRRGPGLPPL